MCLVQLWVPVVIGSFYCITFSDGQKLTKKLLTISLTIFLVTEVVKLNKI